VTSSRYHHGDLRRALLSAAAAEIAESGPAAMSVRRVAARAGVTHTAAAHHFGDKRGLLTALAAEGHRALAEAMIAARPSGMLALGDAYLRFAHEHRPWFDVMFRPELVDAADADYLEATRSSFGELAGASRDPGGRELAYGAWALVHGIAVLWLAGNLPASTLEEVQALFRRSAKALAGGGRPKRTG
jgi:AcrR family transcriptional regulator